jgi:hypothetical protein
MNNVLMSTTWDVISYQHLNHDSWLLCFLTPHLVPINIYQGSLVIFARVLTTKVTESCSFKSWFMLGLTKVPGRSLRDIVAGQPRKISCI